MTDELARLRRAIDVVDDGFVLLLALRRALVGRIAACKRARGAAAVDPLRERQVRARAGALAVRLGVPPAAALRLIDAVIADARRQQHVPADLDQGGGALIAPMLADMHSDTDRTASRHPWLRLLPPPARLAPLLRLLPRAPQRHGMERLLTQVLAEPIAQGALDFMRGRRIGIEVTDLGLAWVIELDDTRLRLADAPAEASVRGSATDLLLLAARLEDADTLFFQRRLVLTGDTELGLTARNLLDRLPWETVPLALRIVLNRCARIAREARAAYHGHAPA